MSGWTCRWEGILSENYFDVIDGPRLVVNENNLNTTLDETEEVAMLGTSVEPFVCAEFEANPSPKYRWTHNRGGTPEMIENPLSDKLGGRRLRIENIVWSDEGEYRCVAYNVINGVRREMPSDARFLLHVSGPPEIQTRPSMSDKDFYESLGWLGEPVHRLKSRFCSRPPPRIVAWQWGSSHLRAGKNISDKSTKIRYLRFNLKKNTVKIIFVPFWFTGNFMIIPRQISEQIKPWVTNRSTFLFLL